jgi:hypothetical protein
MKLALGRVFVVFSCVLLLLGCGKTEEQAQMPAPPIETSDEAIRSAQLTWSSIYAQGDKQIQLFSPESIASGAPFTASLQDGVWSVSGSNALAEIVTTVRVDDGKVMVGYVQAPP